MAGILRVILELFAKTVYMDGNCGIISHGLQSPYFFVERFTVEDYICIGHHKEQQFIFSVL